MRVKEGDIVAFYLNSSYTLLFECEECGFVSKGLMQQLAVSAVAGSVVSLHNGQAEVVKDADLLYDYDGCRKAFPTEVDIYQKAVGV